MKKTLFCLVVVLCISALGMEPSGGVPANVEVLFSRNGLPDLKGKLFSLLDNAKNQVMVAMYWLTDESVIAKLIELKKKGINVQIIFDEDSRNRLSVAARFINNGILPVVFPSITAQRGIVHNKFVIIDSAIVWTGSANFAETVIDPRVIRFNFENVTIIRSQAIAKRFEREFFRIKRITFRLYIKEIATFTTAEISKRDLIMKLCPLLYRHDPLFAYVLNNEVMLNSEQKERVQKFFPGWHPATPKRGRKSPSFYQIEYLKKRGIYEVGMSKEEASQIIEALQAKESARQKPLP